MAGDKGMSKEFSSSKKKVVVPQGKKAVKKGGKKMTSTDQLRAHNKKKFG